MKSIDRLRLFAAIVTSVLNAPSQAHAPTPAPAATAAQAAPEAGSPFSRPVNSSRLATLRGGASVTHSNMTLTGVTSDNTATNVTSGANAIGTGAFANMSGLPLVVQNSGANVLIQNAVIINVQMN